MSRKSILFVVGMIASIVGIGINGQTMNVYAQTSNDVATNVQIGLQSATGLAIAVGGAIVAIIGVVQGFQGKGDHNANASKIQQLEQLVKDGAQKLIDQGTAFQQTLDEHKAETSVIIHFALDNNPALTKFMQDNNLSVETLIQRIKNKTIDISQLKDAVASFIPQSPVATAGSIQPVQQT